MRRDSVALLSAVLALLLVVVPGLADPPLDFRLQV